MNNKAEFYDKLLKRIVFVFCFLFLVFINILRFYQLQTEEKPIKNTPHQKPFYLSFVLFQTQNKTHMIFLQNKNNDTYFHTILKKINSGTFHSLAFINCAQNSFSSLKKAFISEFPDQYFSEENCDINSDRLQELYDQNTLIIFIFKNQNLRHSKALRFAYQNKLKPIIKTLEIKHDI